MTTDPTTKPPTDESLLLLWHKEEFPNGIDLYPGKPALLKLMAQARAAGRLEGRAEQKERDAQIAREFEIKGFPSLSISLPVGNVGELISKEILTQEDKPL